MKLDVKISDVNIFLTCRLRFALLESRKDPHRIENSKIVDDNYRILQIIITNYGKFENLEEKL